MSHTASIWDERAPDIQRMIDEGMSSYDIAEHYGVSASGLRGRITELRQRGILTPYETPSNAPSEAREASEAVDTPTREDVEREILKFGVKREIDGKTLTHKSTRLLELSEEEDKDPDTLLRAHKYDPQAWELVGSTSKVWNVYSVADGVITLYSSTISTRPRNAESYSFEQFVQEIRDNTEPLDIKISQTPVDDKRLLEVSLFDMHFGNNFLDHYIPTQREIAELIASKRWEECLFVIGQDLLHHDNFRSTTANGTIIANANMTQAWKDAKAFYYPLVKLAAKNSNRVKIIYSKGNHDESMSWGFVEMMMESFPHLEFDDDVKERKVHVFGKNLIGFTHGEKTPRKEITRLFPQEFPLEWSQTTCREVHAGDLHREDLMGKDEWGVMFRTLSTSNKTDQWHEDKGFTTAHKRFMLFEYDLKTLRHIHYV